MQLVSHCRKQNVGLDRSLPDLSRFFLHPVVPKCVRKGAAEDVIKEEDINPKQSYLELPPQSSGSSAPSPL